MWKCARCQEIRLTNTIAVPDSGNCPHNFVPQSDSCQNCNVEKNSVNSNEICPSGKHFWRSNDGMCENCSLQKTPENSDGICQSGKHFWRSNDDICEYSCDVKVGRRRLDDCKPHDFRNKL